MGLVYLAEDCQLDRKVALKIPHFDPKGDPLVLERFLREARAAATLDHPTICPVYDVGEINGIHYLTMAYIEGYPLSELLRRNKRLPMRKIALLVRMLALALEEAHQRRVIHRDLKPSNIMINQRKVPVIMDFGLARRIGKQDARLTPFGAALGTPAYMPPEQVNGDVDAMDCRSDMYSLGVTMYELLTGRVPFEGPPMAVLAQILSQEPNPPSAYRHDVDPRLEVITLRAMAKRSEDRFPSMAALAAALTCYLDGTGEASQAELSNASVVTERQGNSSLSEQSTDRTDNPVTLAGHSEFDFVRVGDRRPSTAKKRYMSRGVWIATVSILVLLALSSILIVMSLSEPTNSVSPQLITEARIEAEEMWNRIKDLDSGEEFGERISEIKAQLRVAQSLIKHGDGAALAAYQSVSSKCRSLLESNQQRKEAKRASIEAEESRQQAQLVQASAVAASVWREAEEKRTEAKQYYESAAFSRACASWQQATSLYKRARESAEQYQLARVKWAAFVGGVQSLILITFGTSQDDKESMATRLRSTLEHDLHFERPFVDKIISENETRGRDGNLLYHSIAAQVEKRHGKAARMSFIVGGKIYLLDGVLNVATNGSVNSREEVKKLIQQATGALEEAKQFASEAGYPQEFFQRLVKINTNLKTEMLSEAKDLVQQFFDQMGDDSSGVKYFLQTEAISPR